MALHAEFRPPFTEGFRQVLAELAAALAMRANATLVCSVPDGVEAVGAFEWQSRRLYLEPYLCEASQRPRTDWQMYWTSTAVYVLAHELAHAYGEHDEKKADCIAGRTFMRVAFSLGVPARVAHVLLHRVGPNYIGPRDFRACASASGTRTG